MSAGPASALAIAAGVGRGEARPSDVVAEALERIAARDPALNAVVTTDPADSLRQAEAVERRLAGGERPRLAGVPILVKDAIWVAGWRVTQGSRLFADFRAPRDNVAVARLRAAGAAVVGMANMSEFGCKGVTSNPLHGTTRHPLDARLTSRGSSGGCASALGAGLVPLALGTDGAARCAARPPMRVWWGSSPRAACWPTGRVSPGADRSPPFWPRWHDRSPTTGFGFVSVAIALLGGLDPLLLIPDGVSARRRKAAFPRSHRRARIPRRSCPGGRPAGGQPAASPPEDRTRSPPRPYRHPRGR